LPAACSGCPQDSTDKTDLSVHLHHVHVNVADRERSAQFYEKQLGAQRVLLNGTEEALLSSPMWLLLDVKPMPASRLPTALQHIGWGSMDTKAWYDAAHAQGVAPDTRGGLTVFTTNDTPMVGDVGTGSSVATLLGVTAPACLPVVDPFAYMYVLGPDAERIEVCSGADERVHHLHFTTPDLVTTSRWYARFLGAGNANASPILIYAFYLDDILLVWEEVGQASDYKPTDDHVLSHVAFSVADLEVWLKRAKDQNIEIVAEPADAHGFRSFFVRGPDGMLIELVQAAASKELCLNNASSLPPPSIPRAMP
jgi:catechol 2,3-dioxygenase-like lactoylglutathione lyase family enzyme